MTLPDPYQRWSGAPKHWVDLPLERPRLPSSAGPDAEVDDDTPLPDDGDTLAATMRGEWAVVAVALAVAIAAFVLIGGTGGTVAVPQDQPLEHTIEFGDR